MTHKDKAQELVDKFKDLDEFSMDWDADEYYHNSKQCAITVCESKIEDYQEMCDLRSHIVYILENGLWFRTIVDLILEQREIIKEIKKL